MDNRPSIYLDFTSEALYMYYRYITPGGIMKNVDVSDIVKSKKTFNADLIRRNIVLRLPGEDYEAKIFALRATPSKTSAGLYDLMLYSNESNTSVVYPKRDYPENYESEIEKYITGPDALNPVMKLKLK